MLPLLSIPSAALVPVSAYQSPMDNSPVWKSHIYFTLLPLPCQGETTPAPASPSSLPLLPPEFAKTYFQSSSADLGWDVWGSHQILRRMRCSLAGRKAGAHSSPLSAARVTLIGWITCNSVVPYTVQQRHWGNYEMLLKLKLFDSLMLTEKATPAAAALATPLLQQRPSTALIALTPWCKMGKTNQPLRDTETSSMFAPGVK